MSERKITQIAISAWPNDRKIPTEAIVCGKFAVNSQGRELVVKPGGSLYYITHLATGYACGTCFGIRNAQALARALFALQRLGNVSDLGVLGSQAARTLNSRLRHTQQRDADAGQNPTTARRIVKIEILTHDAVGLERGVVAVVPDGDLGVAVTVFALGEHSCVLTLLSGAQFTIFTNSLCYDGFVLYAPLGAHGRDIIAQPNSNFLRRLTCLHCVSSFWFSNYNSIRRTLRLVEALTSKRESMSKGMRSRLLVFLWFDIQALRDLCCMSHQVQEVLLRQSPLEKVAKLTASTDVIKRIALVVINAIHPVICISLRDLTSLAAVKDHLRLPTTVIAVSLCYDQELFDSNIKDKPTLPCSINIVPKHITSGTMRAHIAVSARAHFSYFIKRSNDLYSTLTGTSKPVASSFFRRDNSQNNEPANPSTNRNIFKMRDCHNLSYCIVYYSRACKLSRHARPRLAAQKRLVHAAFCAAGFGPDAFSAFSYCRTLSQRNTSIWAVVVRLSVWAIFVTRAIKSSENRKVRFVAPSFFACAINVSLSACLLTYLIMLAIVRQVTILSPYS